MNISKYVGLLGWTSFVVLTWLNLFGLVSFGLLTVSTTIIFLMLGVFGSTWGNSPQK
jgi:hypothetical protein